MSIVDYRDFYPHFYTRYPNNRCQVAFEQLFQGLVPHKPVIVYSVFGHSKLPPKDSEERRAAYYVVWSGEPFVREDESEFDLRLTMPMDPADCAPNNVVFPFFALSGFIFYGNNWDKYLRLPRVYRDPHNFCAFVTSNNNHDSHVRNKFFQKLSARKPVASMGRTMNNVGFMAPENPDEKGHGPYFDLLAKFRFMICFENSVGDTYLTEKLLNAWLAGTIPIYWGCRKATEWLNPKAFFQLDESATDAEMDALIEKVLALESDPAAYRAMWTEPLLLPDAALPPDIDFAQIREKCHRVLSSTNV
jgi:hypothetical protein